MNDEELEEEYRYIFLLRNGSGAWDRNGNSPTVDSFYQLTVPPGITGDQARVMVRLNPEFCQEEIARDGHAMKGMSLRMRFNQDMYQKVLLVKTTTPITAEDLDKIIEYKYNAGTLTEFLKDASITV